MAAQRMFDTPDAFRVLHHTGRKALCASPTDSPTSYSIEYAYTYDFPHFLKAAQRSPPGFLEGRQTPQKGFSMLEFVRNFWMLIVLSLAAATTILVIGGKDGYRKPVTDFLLVFIGTTLGVAIGLQQEKVKDYAKNEGDMVALLDLAMFEAAAVHKTSENVYFFSSPEFDIFGSKIEWSSFLRESKLPVLEQIIASPLSIRMMTPEAYRQLVSIKRQFGKFPPSEVDKLVAEVTKLAETNKDKAFDEALSGVRLYRDFLRAYFAISCIEKSRLETHLLPNDKEYTAMAEKGVPEKCLVQNANPDSSGNLPKQKYYLLQRG